MAAATDDGFVVERTGPDRQIVLQAAVRALGHMGFSPDGGLLAVAGYSANESWRKGGDQEVSLWPMPEPPVASQPPIAPPD